MKRFITYLYDYETGRKGKNVGFVRMTLRHGIGEMDLVVRSYDYVQTKGKVCGLFYQTEYFGIVLGEIELSDGHGNTTIRFDPENIGESGLGVDDMLGIGVSLGEQTYVAFFDDEADTHRMKDGFFIKKIRSGGSEKFIKEMELQSDLDEQQNMLTEENVLEEAPTSYEKISLEDLRQLPSPNWHYANNSFLLHGFANYGYLLLKKEVQKDTRQLFLGVPGVFEKPEMVMAVVFGFTDFQALTEELVEIETEEKEKSQPPKAGTFGCWLVELKQ